VGLFYFAGHGMQVRGANYLIPVKAEIASEEEVEVEGLDVAYVMARMATARNQFNIVILDACRNNPFQRSFRSVSNGLAAISAPTGTLIAYATAPGSVASDGDTANGIYTSELVKAIRQPGVSMEEAFKNARSGVIARTQGKQTPWESSSVVGNFIFKVAPATQVASLPAPVKDNATEIAFWNTVKDSHDPRDFQAYLDSYPNGGFERLARIRVATLQNTRAEPARAAVGQAAVTPAPVEEKSRSAPAVASLVSPAKLTDQPTGDDGYEGMLRQNWPQVEAALKAHWQKEFARYRTMAAAAVATTLPLDLKVTSASLQSADPATRKAVIMIAGQRQEVDRVGGAIWASFNAPFSYAIDVVGGSVVIGEFHPAAAQQAKQ
jgi:hypothetical protein